MSYYFLAASDGGTGDGPEYAVSREFIFKWGVYEAVQAEFIYLWGIMAGVQAQFTYIWKVISTQVTKQWTFKWNVGQYIEMGYTYLWNVYDATASAGSKVKYRFKTSALVNRFYRTFRNG